MHEKSAQISCSFWNSLGAGAFVDCLLNLLHVGEFVYLLGGGSLVLVSMVVLVLERWPGLGRFLLPLGRGPVLAKHAPSFSLLSLLGQSHYNKEGPLCQLDDDRTVFVSDPCFYYLRLPERKWKRPDFFMLCL